MVKVLALIIFDVGGGTHDVRLSPINDGNHTQHGEFAVIPSMQKLTTLGVKPEDADSAGAPDCLETAMRVISDLNAAAPSTNWIVRHALPEDYTQPRSKWDGMSWTPSGGTPVHAWRLADDQPANFLLGTSSGLYSTDATPLNSEAHLVARIMIQIVEES